MRLLTTHEPADMTRLGLDVAAAGIAFGLVVLVVFAIARIGGAGRSRPRAGTADHRRGAARPEPAAASRGHGRSPGHGTDRLRAGAPPAGGSGHAGRDGRARSSRPPVLNPTSVYSPGGLIDVPREGRAPGTPGGQNIPEILRTAGPAPGPAAPAGGRSQDRPSSGWAGPHPSRPGYQPGMNPGGPGRAPYAPGGQPVPPMPPRDHARPREAPRSGHAPPGREGMPGRRVPGARACRRAEPPRRRNRKHLARLPGRVTLARPATPGYRAMLARPGRSAMLARPGRSAMLARPGEHAAAGDGTWRTDPPGSSAAAAGPCLPASARPGPGLRPGPRSRTACWRSRPCRPRQPSAESPGSRRSRVRGEPQDIQEPQDLPEPRDMQEPQDTQEAKATRDPRAGRTCRGRRAVRRRVRVRHPRVGQPGPPGHSHPAAELRPGRRSGRALRPSRAARFRPPGRRGARQRVRLPGHQRSAR